MKKFLLTLALLAFIFRIYAQCDICSEALQKDIVYLDYSSFSEEHLMQIVDETNFHEMKTESNKQKHYEASYKVYSSMMKESNSFSDFEKKRNTHFTLVNFTSTKQESLKYFQNKMSAKGYNSFDNCVNKCMGKTGLYLTVVDESDCEVTLSLEYVAGVGNQDTRLVIDSGSVDYLNCTPASTWAKKLQDQKNQLTGLSKIEFVVKKNDNAQPLNVMVHGTLNGDIVNGSIKLPPRFDFEKEEEEKTIELTLHTDSNCTLQKCLGLSNIKKIEIISFIVAGRTSDHPQATNGEKCPEPDFIATNTTSCFNTLQFGAWHNPDCKTSINDYIMGNGWHCSASSCCTGGNQLRKVANVKVKVTYVETTYKQVPVGCN